MRSFTSHPDDQLWKFKIKDLFPHDDELARHVLMVLAANEDLSNIERFKTLLETEKPRPGIDEISQAKWNRGHFFLAKLSEGTWSGLAIQHFAACGGKLVHLVSLACLVCLVRRKKEKGTATVLTVKHVEPAPGARGSDV